MKAITGSGLILTWVLILSSTADRITSPAWTNSLRSVMMCQSARLKFFQEILEFFSAQQFMESQGLVISPPESTPPDPYMESRKKTPRKYKSPSDWDQLKKFLTLDRKVGFGQGDYTGTLQFLICGQVLRFYCVWDDRDQMFGELLPFVLHYFLVDDTIEVLEAHQPNDGRDPFPVLMRRHRIPKNRDDIDSK